ncbi:hypothetical protein RchiOBHm_Chr1g0335221 [Rosa chinensis]|uniref:Uncharacterized protein n=1 Tax=Rosa chinensis TaxID=74649 RepID=A0A2P6SCK4_ROSCH|nr:hypothetical protein RchiOBHm_Chr1g0335221 [Rosa chinensis]
MEINKKNVWIKFNLPFVNSFSFLNNVGVGLLCLQFRSIEITDTRQLHGRPLCKYQGRLTSLSPFFNFICSSR